MALDCDYFRLGHRSQSLCKEKIGQNFLDLAENFKTYLPYPPGKVFSLSYWRESIDPGYLPTFMDEKTKINRS